MKPKLFASKIPRPVSREKSGIPVRMTSMAKPANQSLVTKGPSPKRNVIRPIITKKAAVPLKMDLPLPKVNKTIIKRKSFGRLNVLRSKNGLKQTTIPATYFKHKSPPFPEDELPEEMNRKEKENSCSESVPTIVVESPTMSMEELNKKLSSEFDRSEFYLNQILSSREITFSEAQKLSPILKAYKAPTVASLGNKTRQKSSFGSEKKAFFRSTRSCDVKKTQRPKLSSTSCLSPLLIGRVTWAANSQTKSSTDPFQEAMAGIQRLSLMRQNTPISQRTPDSSSKKLDAFENAMQKINALNMREAKRNLNFDNSHVKDGSSNSQTDDSVDKFLKQKLLEITPIKKLNFETSRQFSSSEKNKLSALTPKHGLKPMDSSLGRMPVPLRQPNVNSLANIVMEQSSSVYRPLKALFENSAIKKAKRLTDISEKSEGENTRPPTPNSENNSLMSPVVINDRSKSCDKRTSPFTPRSLACTPSGIRFTPYKMDLRGSVNTVQTVTPSSNISTPSNSILIDRAETKSVYASNTPICSPVLFPAFPPSPYVRESFLSTPLKIKSRILQDNDCKTFRASVTDCQLYRNFQRKLSSDELADQECAAIMDNQWRIVRHCRAFLRNPVALILDEMELTNFIPVEEPHLEETS